MKSKKAVDSLKEPSPGNLASLPTPQSVRSNLLESDQNKKPTSPPQKKMPRAALILALAICLAAVAGICFSLHPTPTMKPTPSPKPTGVAETTSSRTKPSPTALAAVTL
jgi:hypothetical protein